MSELKLIKGMTDKRREALAKMGVGNLAELLGCAPVRYVDMDAITPIAEFSNAFSVYLVNLTGKPKRWFLNGRAIVLFQVSDGTGTVDCYFFNQPYMVQKDAERPYVLYGRMGSYKGKRCFVNPMMEDADRAPAGITPFYSVCKGINQKTMRLLVRNGLDYAKEQKIFERSPLQDFVGGSLWRSYHDLHFPPDFAALEQAKQHLKYEETLYFACAMNLIHDSGKKALPIAGSQGEKAAFLKTLPYQLTGAQQRTIEEIESDLGSDRPMNRLLQGDVGSGKTVVAVYTMYLAAKSGYQCAFMSPTEVLAVQNYQVCEKLLAPFGLRVALLTGHTKKKERQEILAGLQSGEIDILVGTHALIQDDVEFAALNLVITDEQHRFGVRQRAKLSRNDVHTLIMSATPIPRTLALIAFDKLHLSVIDEMPGGRQPITTRIVGENKRSDLYDYIAKQCKMGEQCYVVCPLIDQSEMLEARSAKEIFAEVAQKVGGQLSVQLLHGRQKAEDKNAILDGFREGKVDILVSTTVVEVGVNVPNATIMVIENAERFGLAQLHQLRGRVGRGSKKSWCFAVTSQPEAIERLQIFKDNSDGLTLAKYDLSVRGMGEFLGFAQHGSYVFRFTDLYQDTGVIQKVQQYLRSLKGSPVLEEIQKQTMVRYQSTLQDVILN